MLLSLAIVTLNSWWQVLFRKVQKKSPKYAVNVFEGEESYEPGVGGTSYKDIELQRWLSEINNDTRKDANQGNKMRTYRLFKTTDNYKCEDYLHQVTNTRHRIALTKLRLSNHKLAIETGRYSRPFKKPPERTCPICKIEMEDEYHFLDICPAYQEKRSSLLDYLENEYRIKISRMSPNRIFMFLIIPPNGNVRIQKLIAKHIFECFEKRKGEDGKVNTQWLLSPWVFT